MFGLPLKMFILPLFPVMLQHCFSQTLYTDHNDSQFTQWLQLHLAPVYCFTKLSKQEVRCHSACFVYLTTTVLTATALYKIPCHNMCLISQRFSASACVTCSKHMVQFWNLLLWMLEWLWETNTRVLCSWQIDDILNEKENNTGWDTLSVLINGWSLAKILALTIYHIQNLRNINN